MSNETFTDGRMRREQLDRQEDDRERYRRDVLFRCARHYLRMAEADSGSEEEVAHTHRMFACCAMLDDSSRRWKTAKRVRHYLVDVGLLENNGDRSKKTYTDVSLQEAMNARVQGLPGFDRRGVRQDNEEVGGEEGSEEGPI